MPTPLLNAYAEQLPRLRAEESLLAVQRVAAGSVRLTKTSRRRILDRWERQTLERPPVVRPASRAMYDAQMAGLGIGVKTERVNG